jgi:hypothetical protein
MIIYRHKPLSYLILYPFLIERALRIDSLLVSIVAALVIIGVRVELLVYLVHPL